MPEAKDTLLRLFSLLRLIPEYPRYSTAPTLHEKLRDRGFYVDLRTVQRDLQRLSGPFSLIDEEEGGRKQWSHAKNAPLDLRDMEPATALALYLAATAATGLSWNIYSFCLFRFLTGAGIGGEQLRLLRAGHHLDRSHQT